MHAAVIIPFRGNADLLTWTLQGYAQQQLSIGHRLSIHVGIDGTDTPLPPQPANTIIHRFPRQGAAAVRNALVRTLPADADLLIFGNADARPAPDMVHHHINTMSTLPNAGTGCMVLGSAPWELPATPTVFDQLLAHTPMIFFYDRVKPHEWHDYRHAWTLNLSMRRDDFTKAGGFHEELRPVYYEDLALGFRIMGPNRRGIFYQPAAQVLHRHPTTFDQYLDREELLGLMAPVLARVCPEAFANLFGTTDAHSLATQFRDWIKMDLPMHQWIYRRMAIWERKSPDLPPERESPDSPSDPMLLTIYQMHIPLKRLAFRLGFLAGIDLAADQHWQSRQPQGRWRKHLAL